MKVTWSITNGYLRLTLTPETDGDKMALKYCNGFKGEATAHHHSEYYKRDEVMNMTIHLEPDFSKPMEEQ